MSHFTVAVLHKKDSIDEIERLLAPYSENIQVEPYIWKTREEAIAYAKECYDYPEKDKTEEDYLNMLVEEGYKTDKEGNIYSTYNQNSKWDWWVVGGRWSEMIHTKDDEYTNTAKIKDIDFTPDKEEYKDAIHFWEVIVEGKIETEDDEQIRSFYNKDYYLSYYKTKEEYAKQMTEFNTFAVVTPDGTWYEKGSMGWFGISDETPEKANEWNNTFKERFVDTADPELYLTIVDCHI